MGVLVGLLFIAGCASASKGREGIQTQSLKSRPGNVETETGRKGTQRDRLSEETEHMKGSRRHIHQEDFIATDGGYSGLAGVSVKQIQKALKNAGFYQGAIDGKMGGQTLRAVVKFQRANRLSSDGAVEWSTWEKLEKYSR
jgi:hypothetical protein